MKLFFTSAVALLCGTLFLNVSIAGQDQSFQFSSRQEQDARLVMILEKLEEKAQQYRENHILLLRTWRSKLQYFKDDLTTPKDKPKEYEGESIVIRRPLPDKSSESGLFVIGKWKEADAKDAKKQDHSLKEEKAYPFVSELDFLLAKEQANYQFSYGGQEDVQGRKAHVVNFVLLNHAAPKMFKKSGKSRFSAAPRKGSILVDAESFDVLRIDWTLIENYQLHLDWGFERKGIFFVTRPDIDLKWEKWNTTLKFKKYNYPNAEQGLWLPESTETLWIVRGARKPVYRQLGIYNYKRFSTDVRIFDDVKIESEKEELEEKP